MELRWSWIIRLKLHWARDTNGLVHLYTSFLPSSFHHILPLCSSLKHTLCKWHNFQKAQQALFTQLSDRSRLACSAVLCSSKCRFSVWREGVSSVPFARTTRERNQNFWLCSEATSVVKFFSGGGETREHFVLQFSLKWFFEEKKSSTRALTAVFSLDKVGHTVDEEKNKLQHFQACVVPYTALRESNRGG